MAVMTRVRPAGSSHDPSTVSNGFSPSPSSRTSTTWSCTWPHLVTLPAGGEGPVSLNRRPEDLQSPDFIPLSSMHLSHCRASLPLQCRTTKRQLRVKRADRAAKRAERAAMKAERAAKRAERGSNKRSRNPRQSTTAGSMVHL
eukprot:scaffold26514_cov53-Phaeocystis_antarctica.AAC.7